MTADDPIVRAQHEETGRLWEGLRSQIPERFFEIPLRHCATCQCNKLAPAVPVPDNPMSKSWHQD